MEQTDAQITEMFDRLKMPFPAEDLDWRIQGTPREHNGKTTGLVLPYITNRAVMDRLDSVVGAQNWRNEFAQGPIGGVLCGIAIRINGEWIIKFDGADKTDVEAIKGGYSDAMKRAAVQWGIGRYLYELPKYWAECKSTGGKYFEIVRKPTLPQSALPAGYKPNPNRVEEVGRPEETPDRKSVQELTKAPVATAPAAPERPAVVPASPVVAPTTTPVVPTPVATAPAKYTETDLIGKAREKVIPAGLPGEKKTIGTLLDENPVLGMHLIKILAGKNPKVPAFVPTTDDQKKLVIAAQYLLDHLATEDTPVAA